MSHNTEKHWTETIGERDGTTHIGSRYIDAAKDAYSKWVQEHTLVYINGDTQYETAVMFIIGGTREQRIEKLVAKCITDDQFDGYSPVDFGCYAPKQENPDMSKMSSVETIIAYMRRLSMKVASHSMYGRRKPYGYDWDLDSDSVDWEQQKIYQKHLTYLLT